MIPTHRLVLKTGPNAGKVFPIIKTEMVIGRETGDDIVIKDPEISRRHARVSLQGAYFVVEDLGSTNGSSLNGQRLSGPNPLQDGDVITLGEKTNLVFEPVREADTILNPHVQAPATIPAQGGAVIPPAPQPVYYQQVPAYQQVPPVQPAYPQPPAPPFQQAVPQYQPQRPQPIPVPPPVQEYADLPYLEPVQKKGLPTWAILLIILGVMLLCIGCVALVLTMTPLGCSAYEMFGMECVTY